MVDDHVDECFFSYQLTCVVPEKRAVKWLLLLLLLYNFGDLLVSIVVSSAYLVFAIADDCSLVSNILIRWVYFKFLSQSSRCVV